MRIPHLEAVSKFTPSASEVPAVETGHTPGCPHPTSVQLALGGHLHRQSKPVVLDQPVANASGKVWLGQLLDGGDAGPSRGHQLTQEVHTTEISGKGEGVRGGEGGSEGGWGRGESEGGWGRGESRESLKFGKLCLTCHRVPLLMNPLLLRTSAWRS